MDLVAFQMKGNDPKHQFLLRASANLARRVEWDSTVRFVSRLPLTLTPHYFELDSRVGWSPTPKVELSVIGRNLLHARHAEFDLPPSGPSEEVQRNIYGRVALRF